MRGCVHLDGLPVHVVGPAEREVDEPDTDGVVRHPVDDDEATHVTVLRVRVEGHWLFEGEVAHADLVQLERLGGHVFQRVDVHQNFGSSMVAPRVVPPIFTR